MMYGAEMYAGELVGCGGNYDDYMDVRSHKAGQNKEFEGHRSVLVIRT